MTKFSCQGQVNERANLSRLTSHELSRSSSEDALSDRQGKKRAIFCNVGVSLFVFHKNVSV